MVELHVGKLLPDDAHNAQAIMLLFDDESASTIKRIQEYWYSKINLYFSHVPLFLVRSKCDLRTRDEDAPPTLPTELQSFNPTNGVLLKNSMHAMRYLECSAKQMNGVKYVFFEILGALKPENSNKEPDDCSGNLTMSPTQALAAVVGRLGSSGPLLRQIMVNARECVLNPAAFPDIKQSVCGRKSAKRLSASPSDMSEFEEGLRNERRNRKLHLQVVVNDKIGLN
ncbi:Ras family protein [Ancylostoma caninum]|uniref:Ras family protein n=1 Tax=Ancylostoma caninum TaxID=29170 RepID=A0A368GLM2_ANCCA|nr:Ras family protein [Ancylostoma caninum]